MIKQPNAKTIEAIDRLRNIDDFKQIIAYIKLQTLYNYNTLTSCAGEDMHRRQGECIALNRLLKQLTGKDVFDA